MSRDEGFRGKRIVVTGGAGMLGSTLVHRALERGAAVTVVDAMLPLYGGNLHNLPLPHDRLTFLQGDIRDAALMERVLESADYVFNLAAQVSYLDADRDPMADLDINCRGHLCVLEACRRSGRPPTVVFASSRFVYGTVQSHPVDERHPFNCLSVYGIHKLTAEKYHRFYTTFHGVPTVSLRIANPYGPRQQMKHGRYGIVNWFIRKAMEGQPLTIYGDGSQVRDYVYVADVAEAFFAVARSPGLAGEVFNVGSGVGTSFRDMVEVVAAAIPGTVVHHVPWPKDRMLVETGDYVTDIRALRAATGWAPTVPLAEGIRQTIAYYREHWDAYVSDETRPAVTTPSSDLRPQTSDFRPETGDRRPET